jgi:hypothetical protein
MRRSLATLVLLLAGQAAQAQYLAVFVDGRIMKVTGASLQGERRIRLDLPGGGVLEVSVTRIESVIEDQLAPEPEPPLPEPPPSCTTGFGDGGLGERVAYRDEILSAARKADLHPRLVAAVVNAESRFNPNAVSRVGAAGLMQLMPMVWIGAGLLTPYRPADNLRVGCHHLAELLQRYQKLDLALAAYNAGAAAVDRYKGVPPYRETQAYVRRILAEFCPPVAGSTATAEPTPDPAPRDEPH